MKKKSTQQQRSALAIALTGVFLLTGKLFVWKSDEPVTAQQDPIPAAEITTPAETTAPPAESEALPIFTEITYGTEETAIVPIEPHIDEETETVPEPIATEAEAAASVTTAEQTVPTAPEAAALETTAAPAETAVPQTEAPAPAPASDDYFKDALFIGDSRTVGMADYAPIDGATYFATVGLSTYKINNSTSEVPGTKGQSLAQVLAAKQYGKVYIMLGINEIGNDLNATMTHYRELIDRVRQAQPNAIIILEANLHVAYSRSSTDKVVNNPAINKFNEELALLADNQKIFYLDVNPLFDDDTGSLKAELTSDGTHPYAKHYLTWADWLRSHTIPV